MAELVKLAIIVFGQCGLEVFVLTSQGIRAPADKPLISEEHMVLASCMAGRPHSAAGERGPRASPASPSASPQRWRHALM